MFGWRLKSVRTEITAGLVLLVASFSGAGLFSLSEQERALEALRLANDGYLRLQDALGEVRVNQGMMNTLLDRLLDDRERVTSRTWIALARRSRRARLRALRESVSPRGLAAPRDAEDRRLLSEIAETLRVIEGRWAEDDPHFEALFRALGSGDESSAAREKELLLLHEGAVEDRLARLTRALRARIAVIADQAERGQGRGLRLTLTATALAVLLGAITLANARRALAPLTALRDRARAVARGELGPQQVAARDDEIGELAREFERMVGAVAARDADLREANRELEAAEHYLEKVVGSLRAGVMVVTHDGAVEPANDAARQLFDAVSKDSTLRWRETAPGADPGLSTAVASVLAGGDGAMVDAVVLGERVYDAAVVPFVVAEGARSALVVVDEVTEREAARKRVMQAERLAAIGRMAAHVTHEVRNPLSSIALNAEMLADEAESLGDAGREMLRLVRAIEREIDRLTAVTEDYLSMARLPRPRLVREDPGDVVGDIVAFASTELQHAGVRVELRVAEGLPAVRVDESQLRQALLNLVRNARESMEAAAVASPRLVIAVEAAREAGREGVAIRVCDAGPGLAPEAERRLFEVFFSTRSRGTGLGLPLTRELVTAHGGVLRARRAPPQDGGGAEFVVWLPAAGDDSERA